METVIVYDYSSALRQPRLSSVCASIIIFFTFSY